MPYVSLKPGNRVSHPVWGAGTVLRTRTIGGVVSAAVRWDKPNAPGPGYGDGRSCGCDADKLTVTDARCICPGCHQAIVEGECGGEGEGLCMEACLAHDRYRASRGDRKAAARVAQLLAEWDHDCPVPSLDDDRALLIVWRYWRTGV